MSGEKTLPVSWLDEKLKFTTSRTPRLHNKQGVPRPTRSAKGTVAHLQLDMEELRSESMRNQTWGGQQISPRRPCQMTFTTTKVPKFAGVTTVVGNSIYRFLTPSYYQMDGTTPQLPSSCYLTWRVMR